MVRPRAENYEERQLEILDTAAAMFAERGFDGTPMSAIATGCGVSKALLYHYFESKEELLYQMLKSHCLLLIETASKAVSVAGDDRARLESLVQELMALYMGSRDKHVVLMNNLKALSPEQQKEIKTLERQIVSTIKGLIGKLQPSLNEPERTAMAMYLMGAINWTYTWFKPKGAISSADYATMAATMFIEGLKKVR